MPNYVANRIILAGDRGGEIVEAIRNHGGNVSADKNDPPEAVDFNRIVPQPEDIGEGWYDWNCKNWGTKWNCWSSEIDELKTHSEIRFFTAWSMPVPIVKHIARLCKEKGVVMRGHFADEGIPDNSGYFDENRADGFRYAQCFAEYNECLKSAWCDESLEWEE